MQVQLISAEIFEQRQESFESANFLQTRQMAEVHGQRSVFEEVFFIAWTEGDEWIAQGLVGIRRRFRFFKEAVLIQGPLFEDDKIAQLPQMLERLEEFLKEQGIARVEMNPYMMNKVINESLEVVEECRYPELLANFEKAGYDRFLDLDGRVVMGQLFRKDLSEYDDSEAIYKDYSNSLKRDLRKAVESHITIRELELDDLEIFYSILSETSVRKGFRVQDFSYFQQMKESFQDKVKYMVAFLDVEAYKAYYHERIEFFTNRVEELEKELAVREEEGKHVKKTRGLITDAKDQLASYQKRKTTFEALDIHNPMLALSGYLFMCYGDEVISVFGGSHEEYLNFGGSSLLNWEMMKYAKDNGFKYYNFYGTIETNQANQNEGNFNFKRQFGGRLVQPVGNFTKTLSPVLGFIAKFKKI